MSPVLPPIDLSGFSADAWKVPTAYRQGMVIPVDQRPRVCLVTKGIQRRLIDLGILRADPAKLGGDFPNWGAKTNYAVRQFQKTLSFHREIELVADGAVGRLTSTALWRPLYVFWQTSLGIVDNLLMGQGYLESSGDPGAEGDNPRGFDWYDRGLHQINRHAHLKISDEQAYDAAWAIGWSAGQLRAAYDSLGEWRFAVAAHNSPRGAQEWARGDVPDTPAELEARDKLIHYVELVFDRARTTA